MQSLFSVHNNVSLISITIAPGAWITFVVIFLAFCFLYLFYHQPLPSFFRWAARTLFRRRKQRPQDRDIARPIIEEEEDSYEAYSEEERPRRRHIEHTPQPPLLTDYSYRFDNDVYEYSSHGELESKGKEKVSRKEQLRASEKRASASGSSSTSKSKSGKKTSSSKENGTLDPLDASLEDLGPSNGNPNLPPPSRTPFEYPSAHSGFQSEGLSETDGTDDSDSEASAGGYSPPAWRRLGNGDRSSGFWRKDDDDLARLYDLDHPALYEKLERESSRTYESADDGDAILAQAIRTRLPSGSVSPEKERSPEPEFYPAQQHFIDDVVHIKREHDGALALGQVNEKGIEPESKVIRFAVHAEVQHRTEPIEMAISFIRSRFRAATRSWASIFLSSVIAIFSYAALRWISQPAAMRPVPDLVKVAGVARSLEPLIYYSESGIQQVSELQATGVAVWDLGESVRSSNLTSAPIIVMELDELGDSLKTLAVELTKFFANVDGDIDAILIVMDWARRELHQVQHLPTLPLSSAFDNIHNLLSNVGLLEDPHTGQSTRLGALATSLFGHSTPQRTKHTVQRTFNEFLTVLEDAVSSELQHSLALFALFEAIDHQFLNLARTVTREASLQDDAHDDLLSSLWSRILGAKASEVAKYERNRVLLRDVRERTVANKGVLVEHNHRLLALKAKLESLRRKLVSPLVRSVNSSTLALDEQIRGLEEAGSHLERVRLQQKSKLFERVYGGGSGSARLPPVVDTGDGR
ncbi:uncharacterized protein C8A04DRAFT_35931 [Dichotomopilus funicola]|uniref:Uncharacterized protein n=1 Tax=Dichotomopilus funicola TaxID=1934379 RepID=A0AAN6V5L0_9PEZI|nr:hypothetical protein C8A04DRAFT_35931 [Dichotomopilus funicola]